MLQGVLDVLRWEGDQQAALDHAESAYTALLSRQLGSELGTLEAEDPARAARVVSLLGGVDVGALQRVLLAPETCARLLWAHPGRCDDRDVWSYLADALLAEQRSERPYEIVAGLRVDADSPAAVCFDYGTLHRGGMRLARYEDAAERDLALERVIAAMRAIEGVSPALAGFVRRFTLVANVVADSESAKFTSGSTAQYVGRSLFCNAHLGSADVELLAESLVHEATHSLLYMHETREPWILDGHRLPEETVVTSPWSGAELVVRPFLQACFVWFGLVHFWRLAGCGSTLRPHRAAERLEIARRGFLGGPLLERIPGDADAIVPPVRELVEAMQARVVEDEHAPA